MEGLLIPKRASSKSIIIKNTTKRHLPLSQKTIQKDARAAPLDYWGKYDSGFMGISFQR